MGRNTGVSVYLQSHNEKYVRFSDRAGTRPAENSLVINMELWSEMGQPEILHIEVEEGVSGK